MGIDLPSRRASTSLQPPIFFIAAASLAHIHSVLFGALHTMCTKDSRFGVADELIAIPKSVRKRDQQKLFWYFVDCVHMKVHDKIFGREHQDL